MSWLIRKILQLERLNLYPKYWAYLGELFGILMTLVIYHFTAKAFAPNLENRLQFYGMDYFSFVLIGELGMSIPAYLFSNPAIRLKELSSNGALTALMTYPWSLRQILFHWVSAGALVEIARIFTNILLAFLIFDFVLPIHGYLYSAFFILYSAVAFIGLGFLGAAIGLFLGRGGGVLNYISTLSLFLAGAYFPIEVFPSYVKDIGTYISPFNPLMLLIRQSFSAVSFDIPSILALTFWNILGLALGVISLQLAETQMRRKGNPLLFTR